MSLKNENKTVKALLKIGYTCNYHCSFCHAEDKKNIVSINLKSLYIKVLLLKRKGVQTILLTGGEASLEKHFFDLISFIKMQGLDFGIVTNGSTIANFDFLEKLDFLGIKNIYLSVHGFSSVHNNIVGDKSSYLKILTIINNLKNKKHIDFTINYVIVKQNLDSIWDTLSSLEKTGYDGLKIKFSCLEPQGLGKHNFTDLAVPLIDASSLIQQAILKYFGNTLEVSWDGFPPCLFSGFEKERVDLKTQNIEYISEIFEPKIYNTDYGQRSFYKSCDICKIKNKCYGVFSEYINTFSPEQTIKPVLGDNL